MIENDRLAGRQGTLRLSELYFGSFTVWIENRLRRNRIVSILGSDVHEAIWRRTADVGHLLSPER